MSAEAMLSVDPGKRGCGCALWCGPELVRAAYVKGCNDELEGPAAAAQMARAVVLWAACALQGATGLIKRVVLEYQQTYDGSASRGDTNDLLAIAAVDGAIAALLSSIAKIDHYVPHEWKGSVEKPKSVKQPYPIKEWVIDRLRATGELANVDWTKNVRHSWDVADAIGVGLKALNRFERKRVYATE